MRYDEMRIGKVFRFFSFRAWSSMRQKTRLGQQAPFIHISWVLCGREMPVNSLFLYPPPFGIGNVAIVLDLVNAECVVGGAGSFGVGFGLFELKEIDRD